MGQKNTTDSDQTVLSNEKIVQFVSIYVEKKQPGLMQNLMLIEEMVSKYSLADGYELFLLDFSTTSG